MPHVRTNVLDGVFMPDGITKGLDAALSNGVSETLFRARLKRGLSVLDAVLPPQVKRRDPNLPPFDPWAGHKLRAFNTFGSRFLKKREKMDAALIEQKEARAAVRRSRASLKRLEGASIEGLEVRKADLSALQKRLKGDLTRLKTTTENVAKVRADFQALRSSFLSAFDDVQDFRSWASSRPETEALYILADTLIAG